MKKFKDYVIFETKKGYSVFQNEELICKLNFNFELVQAIRRISIADLKEIIKFLQNENNNIR